ncbi:helix-turn-helix domain-containing protein [Streptomyces sp. NPDC057197]|uniref:helix-turn-helix domain-containing protein n=1 Tax=Streptomyces sp. NPDC057197 TaxID=3346045 RepID=UPI003645D568
MSSEHDTARPAPDRPVPGGFGERLVRLIAVHHTGERKRPGYARLAREISEKTGRAISGTYLWELATGRKRNVTLDQISLLADYFGVPAGYFVDDEVAARVDAQLQLAAALRDTRVRNLALRADGLSPATLDALLTMVNEARKVQNLPVDDSTGPPTDEGGPEA